MKKFITATVTGATELRSGVQSEYFILSLKGDDGERYIVYPSVNTPEFSRWKEIAQNGIGKRYQGFQYAGKGNYGMYCNKRVLPTLVEERKEVSWL